jgi:hypothetical protein
MKKIFITLCVLGLFSACGISGHNHAELKQVNPDDSRIYGEKGAPARQTLNTYPADADGKASARVDSIRQKLYPK